jgi:Domain of unknown function (DUF4326)
MAKVLNKHHIGYIPKNAVYVGLGSPYGNENKIGKDGNRAEVIEKYRVWLETQPALIERVKRELKGKDLVCYCAPLPCHGDLLLQIANSEEVEKAQARRETIARQAVIVGDLMTEFDYERMPVALLTGASLDWVEESKMRDQWAKLLDEKGVTLPQFNSYARAAIKNGLLVFEGKNTYSIGGIEELLKPIDFDERIARFLNPEVNKAKPAKKKPQQAQQVLTF